MTLLDFDEVRARVVATRAMQDRIKAKWLWTEATLADWDAALVALDAARDAYSDNIAAEKDARAALKASATNLHGATKQTLGIAKVAFRNDPAKLGAFTLLRAVAVGVSAIITSAQNVSSAWQKADPTWVPLPGKTLALYDAARADVTTKQSALAASTAATRDAGRALRALLTVHDKKSKAWYAVATRVFPTGTPEGDALRAEIRTR